MAVIGDARLQTGMAGNPQTEKSRYVLDVEGFWLCDKCRIRAVNDTWKKFQNFPNGQFTSFTWIYFGAAMCQGHPEFASRLPGPGRER